MGKIIKGLCLTIELCLTDMGYEESLVRLGVHAVKKSDNKEKRF